MVLSLDLALWVISFAGLAVAVVLGLMLVYHWMRYAMDPIATTLSVIMYFTVAFALLFVLFDIAASYHL